MRERERTHVKISLFSVDNSLHKTRDKAVGSSEMRNLYLLKTKELWFQKKIRSKRKSLFFNGMLVANRINIKKSKIQC